MFWKSKRPKISEDDEEWQIACWSWLAHEFGPTNKDEHAGLILPTNDFFPVTDAVGHDKACHFFNIVKDLSGMKDWPCELIAQEETPHVRLGDYLVAEPLNDPLGTFDVANETVTITYNPKQLSEPQQLVATFAHELAHYLLSGTGEVCPGGMDALEPATDVAAVYLGFGIFNANGAFNMSGYSSPYSQGWSISAGGYLSEHEWCYSLAIFAELKQVDPIVLDTHLKTHLAKTVRNVRSYLQDQRWIVEGIEKGDLHT